MQLCDYGCGQEAKYYLEFKHRPNKWCCSKSYNSCPTKRKASGKAMRDRVISEEHKKKISKAKREAWEDPDNVYNSISCREKMSKSNKLTIEKIKEKYLFFSQIEEMRYNPDKPKDKEIQVHCKNNECENSKEKGGWFTPTREQIYYRKNILENEGEDKYNFYCSQKCKDTCPLYGLRFDPFQDTKLPYTQAEYDVWRSKVLERQKEEDGYNFCEKCYSTENLHVHHEKPVKTHPLLALDPDNGIVLCKDCHYEYGHKTGTECSTKALADKVLPGCKIGGQE